MHWVNYLVAGWLTVSVVATIASIGQPRKPTTQGVAITAMLVNGVLAILLIAAARS